MEQNAGPSSTRPWAWLAGVTVVAALVVLAGRAVMPWEKMFPDLLCYWTAGKLVASGQNPYDAVAQVRVQREAGWLGVPCLVLRSSTEWVELMAESAGRMTLVGLDADRAVHELARWAPVGSTLALAAARADAVAIPPAGAATAIADRLATDERRR